MHIIFIWHNLLTISSNEVDPYFHTPVLPLAMSENPVVGNTMDVSTQFANPVVAQAVATLPATATPASEVMIESSTTKPKDKVKRPPNAFIIYRKELHPLVVAENPKLHNNDICKLKAV